MKKFYFTLLIFCLLTSICSCDNYSEIRQSVEDLNSECPQNMGIIGDMISVKFDEADKEVEFYYLVDESVVDINVMNNDNELAKESMKLSFSNSGYSGVLKQLSDAGVNLTAIYKGRDSGKSAELTLSADDMKKILEDPISDDEVQHLLLKNQIAIEKARCPYMVMEGMEMINVFDDGDYIVYMCSMDENLYDTSVFRLNYSSIKESTAEIFTDPTIKNQLKLMTSAGKGLIYRYQGNQSGETFDITFSVNELQRHTL